MAITSILDKSTSAIICNQNYGLALAEVARAGRWNFINTPAQLTAVTQPSVVPNSTGPISAVPWAPLTAYLANDFISYGGYYYNVMFNLTSTDNFFNDLTQGYYTQTDQSICSSVPDPFSNVDGSQYISSWPYAYALPSDFLLMVGVNGSPCYSAWGTGGLSQQTADWQIMGNVLYTNTALAVVQYVRNDPDSTLYDPLFVNALTFKLASLISTTLRQDSGTMEAALLAEYKRALREARQKNGGEQNVRRFDPIATSRFNRARYAGIIG